MLFLIALILGTAFAFLCSKPLKKYPLAFYVAAVVISAASIALANADLRSAPVFLSVYAAGLFTRGAFATALWCVVMWTGALPNGSAPIKKLMPVRGELSIFAAILTLGHNVGFGQTYFVRLFTNPERMATNQKMAGILSIAMLVIMIPLTVMSFRNIRRKINPKLWKKLQRAAYAFYAMIYAHVLLLYYPMAKAGREGIFLNIIVYSVVFLGYGVCRVRKFIVVKRKPHKKTAVNIITAAIFASALTGILITFSAEDKKETQPEKTTYTYSISVTTTASAKQNGNTTTTVAAGTTASAAAATTTSANEENKNLTTTVSQENTTTSTVKEPDSPLPEDESSEQQVIGETDIPPEENNDIPPETENPPEPVYIYKNGTYSASAYGYDGDVFVEITVENDMITSVSARSEESDGWYFDSAQGAVISAILSTQSTDVDAVSGATYSSEAIMAAVKKALDSAKN